MFKKIQWQIFILQVALTLVAVLTGGYYVYEKVEAYEYRQLEQQLSAGIDLSLSLISTEAVKNKDVHLLSKFCGDISRAVNVRATFIASDGAVLGESDTEVHDLSNLENHLSRPEVQMAISKGIGTAIRHSVTVNDNLLYVAKPVMIEGKNYGFFRMAYTLVQVRERLSATANYIWLGGFLGILTGLLISFAVSYFIARPILKIKEIVGKIGKNEFSVKVPFFYRPDEIGELARGIQQMALDLDRDIRRIQEEGNKIQSIITNMSEGVIVLDGQMRISRINHSARRMFDVGEEEVQGRPLMEIIRVFQMSELAKLCKTTGEFQSNTIELFHPIPYSLLVSAEPMKDIENAGGILLVVKDVTELKRLDKIKSDFVANASHELKTPLTSIKGYVETLLETNLDDKEIHKKFLGKIEKNIKRLEALLYDMLELSRIETMTGQEERERISLPEIVQKVSESLKERVEVKKLRWVTEIPEGIVVQAVPHLLEQVLVNLLDNAVKYTPPEGVIKMICQSRNGNIDLIITDTGVGISRQHLPRIFERFYVVDEARSKELGGTGLGLAIVKNAVEALKGKIEVESEIGVGTTFKISIPRS